MDTGRRHRLSNFRTVQLPEQGRRVQVSACNARANRDQHLGRRAIPHQDEPGTVQRPRFADAQPQVVIAGGGEVTYHPRIKLFSLLVYNSLNGVIFYSSSC